VPVAVASKLKDDVNKFQQKLEMYQPIQNNGGIPLPTFRPGWSPGMGPVPNGSQSGGGLIVAGLATAIIVLGDDATGVGVADDLLGLAAAIDMILAGFRLGL
jgi:hypothetical protein